jgi:CheY-like chemotaxis protein
MVADRNKAISLGAVEALTKPVLQAEFMACLQRTLNSDIVENRKVLVVDDLFEFQELMKSWLEGGNNDVRTASNGREALDVLKTFTPEIIFLDLMMPVMDGLSFLQEFRSNDKYADIPVIVVTAKVLSSAERRWLETRAQKIMVKGEEIFSERFPN